MENRNQLMVSIQCLVYNHEPYLRQCLDGIVMQKTNFRFEAIVHDDCSTDGSRKIIEEYADKYPDIIKPIYETENQYSKNDGSLRKIVNARLIGKYIALCEGDDYWIDPLKLQKEVDYLESHLDVGMCFTNFDVKYEETGIIKISALTNYQDQYPHQYDLKQWIAHPGYIGPMTWLTRNELWKSVPKILSSDGTYVFVAHFIKSGKIHCLIDETTAVYRSNKGSITQSNSFKVQYWQKLNFYYAKIALADWYYPNSDFAKNLREKTYAAFFNNAYAKKILSYGSEKDITLLGQHFLSLSLVNKVLFLVCKSSIIRRLFTKVYLTLIHKKTHLEV